MGMTDDQAELTLWGWNGRLLLALLELALEVIFVLFVCVFFFFVVVFK